MKITYKIGLVVLLFSSLIACKKHLDINRDPNNFTEVPAQLLLPTAQVQLGYSLGGDASRIAGAIMQHYGGHRGQPLQYNQFDIDPSQTDGFWSSMYSVVLRDLKAVVDQSRETGDSMYVGVSQILMAHTFSVLTDLYGDIPFSQALLDERNITPGYDKQETIYPALITMIEAGLANVKSNKGKTPGNDDLIYQGVMNNWERYGNSLKLRLLNHLSKRQPNAAAAFLNTNPLLITENSQNAVVTYGTTSSNANPIHGFDVLSGRADMAVGATLVERMKNLSDPRIPKYFEPVVNNGSNRKGQYFGNTPGGDEDDAGKNLFSRIGPAYASINSPVFLIGAAEVHFMIAEVRFREGKQAEAATAYNTAITRDFQFLELAGNAPAYLAKPEVAYNNTLQRIMEQKWITMYQAPYESWVDWRRTGFPALTHTGFNFTGGVIPRRLAYPQLEINLNRASLEAGPGVPVPIEALKQRVWWDAP